MVFPSPSAAGSKLSKVRSASLAAAAGLLLSVTPAISMESGGMCIAPAPDEQPSCAVNLDPSENQAESGATTVAAVAEQSPEGAAVDELTTRRNKPSLQDEMDEIEKALEVIVIDVIRENPQIIFEALQDFMSSEEEKATAALIEQDAVLGVNSETPIFGPLGSGPAVLFFYDYTCEPCVGTALDLARVAYETGHIRLYLIDVAASDAALEASRAVLAGREQGREVFESLHVTLLGGERGAKIIQQIEQELGIDWAEHVKVSEQVDLSSLNKARELASKWGVNTLPTIVIDGEKHEGAISFEEIMALVF